MRLALFTDIHGNYQALKEIIKDIKKNNYDDIIFLGDCIGLGVDSNKCLNLLKKNNIRFILGNHELYYTRGIDIIKAKNSEIDDHNIWINNSIKHKIEDNDLEYVIKYNNKKIVFTHYFLKKGKYPYRSSSIFNNNDYKRIMKEYDCDYMFYGHLHEERIDKINNKYFYSLSSSGCTFDNKTCYYVLNLDDNINLEKIELIYDRKSFENRIKSIDFPNKNEILKEFYGIN